MHPIDVNSINDLFYLSHDDITEMKITGDKLVTRNSKGLLKEYFLADAVELQKVVPPRVAYMIGYVQAEKLMRDAYKENVQFRIVKDNISTLHIENNKTGEFFLKNPIDILFSEEYKSYSKEDIAKIAYVCGQMTKTN